MKKYDDFRKWLMTCPIPYEQEDINFFDDDSIVFLTSKNTDKDKQQSKSMILTIKFQYDNINDDKEELIIQDCNLEMKNNPTMLGANKVWLDDTEYK